MLASGIRQSRPFELKAEIRPGSWFIVGGQKAYVVEMGEMFSNAQGRTDARLRVIFDNGTESNMLMRSLQRSLHKDDADGGSRILLLDHSLPAKAKKESRKRHDLRGAKRIGQSHCRRQPGRPAQDRSHRG